MPNYQPRFSVIIATYNRAYVLWRAIQSVLAQTYPFFEVLVVDDGSEDETEKLVQQFTDPRLYYFRLPQNQGASAARNFGLKKAKADLVAYLDSDNVWYNDFLETMDKAFSKHKDKVLIFCKKNYRLTLVENGQEKRVRDEFSYSRRYFDLKRLWQRRILIDTNTICHRRQEIIDLGGWDENIKFWEDWELALRISTKYPKGFFYLNRTLLDYEQKIDLSRAEQTFALWEKEEKKIFKKYKGNPLLKGQNWFPPAPNNKSTLGVIEYLRQKHKQ